MRNFILSIFILLPYVTYSQDEFIYINADLIDKIVIIDDQNFNYEWYCGRRYEIEKTNGKFEMRILEQYSKPYFFGQSSQTVENDSLKFDKMGHLNSLNISTENPDSLVKVVNEVVRKKQEIWANRIKVKNTNTPTVVGQFNEYILFELIAVINDHENIYPNNILRNLGMDSNWIRENAERLFNSYKLKDSEPTQEQKDYCLSCFNDPNKAFIASLSLVGGYNTSDYPYVEIQFITGFDTVKLYTDNPTPLSMPWIIGGSIKSYNPKISLLLADLLPDLEYSNKKRLSGNYSTVLNRKSIEEVFAKSLIYKSCTIFNDRKWRRRKRIYISAETSGKKR